MGPLWQTILYQSGKFAKLHMSLSATTEETEEFTKLWMNVARTGEGYDLFAQKREEAIRAKQEWMLSYYSGAYTSVAQMRWDWDHVLSFNSLPELSNVHCPALGVFGELDQLTDGPAAANSMRKALLQAGNKDVTVIVFRNASHSLSYMPSGDRMAPGVFDTLRDWLRATMHLLEKRSTRVKASK